MSQWRTSLLKVQKGATARIELATSCTQSRNHTTRPRRLSALRRKAGGESERGKTEKSACRARLANRNLFRKTAQICDSSTPGRTAGKKILPRYRHLSPAAMVRAPLGRGRADECSVRTAPAPVRARGRRSLSRVRASSGTAGIRGQICGSRGWRNPSTRGVVCRSGLSRCDGDLCPADGVRGARGDGSVLGNPPRLQLAACLVSRPRFRSRRPRRRASTSRLSAQCKVARGARAT